MSKVTVRVDRDPAKQPPWAWEFLDHHDLDPSDTFLNPATVREMNKDVALAAKRTPFIPPVTLTYTDQHEWEFSWDSEADELVFRLKWS